MSIKKIRGHNGQQFIDDLKRVRTVMVWASFSGTYLTVTKKEVLKEAMERQLYYSIRDDIFRNGRDVLVIK